MKLQQGAAKPLFGATMSRNSSHSSNFRAISQVLSLNFHFCYQLITILLYIASLVQIDLCISFICLACCCIHLTPSLYTCPPIATQRAYCTSLTMCSSCDSCVSKSQLSGEEFMSKLLDRRWASLSPEAEIHQIMLSVVKGKGRGEPLGNLSFFNNIHPNLGNNLIGQNQDPSFYILRDDLLHPLVNGNKARKLDALLPLIEDHSVTDVVTCGGCQSAHAASVAVLCAERGLKSHLLLRGEQPEILTGYNLVSSIYGNVIYVPRSIYSHREKMLKNHAEMVAGDNGNVLWCNDILEDSFTSQTSGTSKFVNMDVYTISSNCQRKVVIVNEGAGEAAALLGVLRLVQYLAQDHLLGKQRAFKFVVDAGTGTTAVGFALGAKCLGLQWDVTAVILADTIEGYRQHEKRLISDFKRQFCSLDIIHKLNEVNGDLVCWVERQRPRKFGNVFEGEIVTCQQIAQQTGILVDPVYTLAAWETTSLLSQTNAEKDTNIMMLHTGGTLGMFGLAQRYKSYFHKLKHAYPVPVVE